MNSQRHLPFRINALSVTPENLCRAAEQIYLGSPVRKANLPFLLEIPDILFPKQNKIQE